MKKTIALIFILITIAMPYHSPVRAQTSAYAMVISDEACLYADASGVMVKYILPKSYFVYVTDNFGELARVCAMQGFSDCPQVEGYVKLVDLKFFSSPPQNPYLNLSLTVISDEVLFGDAEAKIPKTVLAKGSVAKYYGECVINNQKYFYVYANGYIGYVRNSCFDEPIIPLHPEYIKIVEQNNSKESDFSADSDSVSAENPSRGIDTSGIIVIALIIICGLCVLYFIFKPEKISDKSIYKDDD